MDNLSMGKRIEEMRKAAGMTQQVLADRLGVTAQAVSLWETGRSAPDVERISELAEVFGTTGDYLMEGKTGSLKVYSERIFDEEHMHSFIKGYATAQGLTQTVTAMAYAKEAHKNQFRKGDAQVPYIAHPLNMVCQAIALGIRDDDVLAAAMLHDVCEDCGIESKDLPVSDTVKKSVNLLTKVKTECKDKLTATRNYYDGIKTDKTAALVKLLDRCNNVSFMAYAFSPVKLEEYIDETRIYVLPLADVIKNKYPEYSNQSFLLKYHICSVIGSIEAALSAKNKTMQ